MGSVVRAASVALAAWAWATGGGPHCGGGGPHQRGAGGPRGAPPQDRTCVSGMPCSIDGLVGHRLEEPGQLRVLDTCGAPAGPPGMPHLSSSGAGAWTTAVRASAAGGVYRLCWCLGDLARPSAGACSVAEEFSVDAGAITLLGIAPSAQDHVGCGGV